MCRKFSKEEMAGYFTRSVDKFRERYNRADLFKKIGKVAKTAGRDVVYNVLLLYYALISDGVSKKDKVLIAAALGYFISPVDLIPDLLGLVGFTDDLAVLTFVGKTIFNGITPEVQDKARQRLAEWFGEDDKSAAHSPKGVDSSGELHGEEGTPVC